MSSSFSNVVRLFPPRARLPSFADDLPVLRSKLTVARQGYLSAAAELDSSSIKLGLRDPQLRSHALLSQIDRMEASITALADAIKMLRARA